MTIWTGSATKSYDGEPLVCEEAGFDLVSGKTQEEPWRNTSLVLSEASGETLYGLAGELLVHGTNPITGETSQIALGAGEKLTVRLSDESNADSITFRMLYKCESEMKRGFFPRFGASSKDEERWNPAFWNFDRRETVIGFEHANSIADALIRWYEDVGVQDIGYEDTDSVYDSDMIYIGKGPNGLQELLKLVAEIASELQTEGYIEAKFGRKIPIIIADFEFTWYMLAATRSANPNGEADEYIEACLRHGWALEEQIYGSDF